LLAIAVYQPTPNCLTHRHREQAHSHRDWCQNTNPDTNQKPVGAELARDSGLSADTKLADPPPSRASFAPTGIGAKTQIPIPTKKLVGAELARDSGLSADIKLAAPLPSRAGSLLQGLVLSHKSRFHPKNLWELSLLAIAVCQPAHNYLTHRYREQAHSHRDWCQNTNPDTNQKPVGAELARDSGGSVTTIFNWRTAIASKLCSHSSYLRSGR